MRERERLKEGEGASEITTRSTIADSSGDKRSKRLLSLTLFGLSSLYIRIGDRMGVEFGGFGASFLKFGSCHIQPLEHHFSTQPAAPMANHWRCSKNHLHVS
ncbi:hypothetical protein CsSME_00043199 [Camellia sinensis var. sinensis]